MTDDSSRVFREAREAASGLSSSLVERLGERVSARSGAANVFGEPVAHDGVTVIPVARVRWGFGGGSGSSAEDRDRPSGEGSGGGAGLAAAPIGFIEIANGRASFHRIWALRRLCRWCSLRPFPRGSRCAPWHGCGAPEPLPAAPSATNLFRDLFHMDFMGPDRPEQSLALYSSG